MSVSCAHILLQRWAGATERHQALGHAGQWTIRVSKEHAGLVRHHSYEDTHPVAGSRHTPYNSNTSWVYTSLCQGGTVHMLALPACFPVVDSAGRRNRHHRPMILVGPALSYLRLSACPTASAAGSEQKGKILILQLAAIASIWEPQNDFTS